VFTNERLEHVLQWGSQLITTVEHADEQMTSFVAVLECTVMSDRRQHLEGPFAFQARFRKESTSF
jgi:hypothetical protein